MTTFAYNYTSDNWNRLWKGSQDIKHCFFKSNMYIWIKTFIRFSTKSIFFFFSYITQRLIFWSRNDWRRCPTSFCGGLHDINFKASKSKVEIIETHVFHLMLKSERSKKFQKKEPVDWTWVLLNLGIQEISRSIWLKVFYTAVNK